LFKIDKNMKVDEEEGNDDGLAINDIDGFKSDDDSADDDDDDDNDNDVADDADESDEDED
jgi:hypothetical protein